MTSPWPENKHLTFMAKQLSQRLGEQPLGSYKPKAAEKEISQKPAGYAWIPIFGNQKKLFLIDSTFWQRQLSEAIRAGGARC